LEIEQPPFASQGAADALRARRDAELARRLAEVRAALDASTGLSRSRPDLSSRRGATLAQKIVGLVLLAATSILLIIAPMQFGSGLLLLVSIAFVLIITMRVFAGLMALRRKLSPPAQPATALRLPLLTVLVPLLREANMVAGLVKALSALAYPVERMEIKLLVEADDIETTEALMRLDLPVQFEILPVPPNEPRTKPRALNYGLALSRGEIVAVFDAEDRPDPRQPRQAVDALMHGGGKIAVVQAPLLIDSAQGWFASQFALEYAVHFGVWLPFLARIGAPLALGGTSNYFLRDKLVEAGGWDAWNVTEDADLGLRIARFGGKAAMIEAPTWEEAPSRFDHWLAQRTRWMKGHLQTWLVLHRNPLKTARDMGWRSFLLMQVTFSGALLASLSHGLIMLWLAWALSLSIASIESWHAVLFVFGYGSVLLAIVAARTKHKPWWALLTLWAYWPLASLAMLRAIGELGFKPHYWAKTPHGVARKPTATAAPPLGENVIQLELFER
jgi:cellulose synthase/poly-beta-1,6-N-acetylglucosamine synthase-like glycosyltransferase